MKVTLHYRKKLRKGELRLKIEVDFWKVLVVIWALGLFYY